MSIICIVIVVALCVLLSRATPSSSPSQMGASTSTKPTDTYGMAEYTDEAYGFYFWYPNTLPVTARSIEDSIDFPGGVAVENLQIGSAGGTSIFVVNSPNSIIVDEPNHHASPIPQTEYFYDSSTQQWMIAHPEGTDGGDSAATTTAGVSQTTIGGLVMLQSGRRFDTTIIPLSTTRFLVISDGGGSSFTSQLARTVALSGSIINIATYEAALQAETAASTAHK